MNWYYIDGPLRIGPLNESEWAELVRSGKIGPETLVWHEGVEKWTPYRLMNPPAEPESPEFETVLESPVEENPEVFAARVADLDFAVDLNRCISRGWTVFKAHFWELVGATFLVFAMLVAASRLPILEYVVPMLLQGVLLGGLYKIYLQRLRGQPAAFTDLFAGFDRSLFQQLALQTLVIAMVTQLCFVPAVIATVKLGIIPANFEAMMASSDSLSAVTALQTALAADPQKTFVWLLVVLACSIPAVYFGFCWMFAIPLVVDKGLSFWPAMKLSRNKVLQHPWRIGVLSVVAGGLGFAGALGLGIGMIFTLPLYFLTKLALYEEIFNAPAAESPRDS